MRLYRRSDIVLCPGCQKERPVRRFYKNPANYFDGAVCKNCRMRHWKKVIHYNKSHSPYTGNNKHATGTKRCRTCLIRKKLHEYNRNITSYDGLQNSCKMCLSIARYMRIYGMVIPADASCEICGIQKHLCIDHDHTTGYIRGILCRACNTALGLLQEDIIRLLNMTDYIERYK